MTTDRDRIFKSYRAFLPSDIYRGSESRTPGEVASSEREDPRRSRTEYFVRLEREVAQRTDSNSLLEGDERRNEASFIPAVAKTGAEWVQGNPSRPIDAVTERCFNVVVQDDREDDDMSTETMDPPKAAVKKTAKPKTTKRPNLTKKLQAQKKRDKAARPKKAKGTPREQTCVNIPIPVKKALDQKAKKLGTSRSRLMIEAIAKSVGVKLKKTG